MMPAVRTFGILFFALAAGCAGVKAPPPGMMAQSGQLLVDPSRAGPSQDGAVAAEPPRSTAKEEANVAWAPPPAGPHQPVKAVMTENETIGLEPVADTPTPPSRNQSAAKAALPPAKATRLLAEAPAKVSAAPPASEPPRKNEEPPPVAKALEPTLDVAGLTARLRDTKAIGVFTKLALKGQVDDLLKQIRTQHQSGQKTNVASLRQPYDMLVLKVLSVVQDGDPSLARTISGSREAIWGILADPEKFNSVA
jgi:hypothetical protein